ncbi:flagellar hook-basal body complex protein [bacterium]|nr:flagellar hook-basal body complex protein [bacterium]
MTYTKSNNAPNEWDYELHLNLEDNQYVADVYNDPLTGLPILKPLKLYTFDLDGPDTTNANVTLDWNTFPFIHEDNGLSFSDPADLTNTPLVNADLSYRLEVTGVVGTEITFSVEDNQGRQYKDYVLDPTNPREYVTDLDGYAGGWLTGGAAGAIETAAVAAVLAARVPAGALADRIDYTEPLPGEGFVWELDYDANFVVGDQIQIDSHRSTDTLKNVAYDHDFVTHENLNDPKNSSNVDQTQHMTDDPFGPGYTATSEGQYSKRGHIVFDPNTGFIDEGASSLYNLRFWPTDDEGQAITSEPIEIVPDFSKITQYNSPFTTAAREQNGYTMGRLQTFNVDENGVIRGVYSNGYKMPLGQVALATFNNTGGLLHEGETMYTMTANSGNAFVTAPNENGKGKVSSGVLEMANVDLSKEFTGMIVIQRGFQANSRVITTADQMLQELVNLKR